MVKQAKNQLDAAIDDLKDAVIAAVKDRLGVDVAIDRFIVDHGKDETSIDLTISWIHGDDDA